MNIDTLHSALISLIVLPEALHWARKNLVAADHTSQVTLEAFLNTAERDLATAKATLALELGFSPSCRPPQLLATDDTGKSDGSTAPSAGAPSHTEPQFDPFTHSQRERLLQLRDDIIDSITGVAKTNLRDRAGIGADASRDDAADAGNDAFDCDLALSLLAQERDALFEIDDALRRIAAGSYGICEISGRPIPHVRLEAIPFARLTVQCQASLEKQRRFNRTRRSITPTFEGEEESVETEAEDEVAAGQGQSRRRTPRVSAPERAASLSRCF